MAPIWNIKLNSKVCSRCPFKDCIVLSRTLQSWKCRTPGNWSFRLDFRQLARLFGRSLPRQRHSLGLRRSQTRTGVPSSKCILTCPCRRIRRLLQVGSLVGRASCESRLPWTHWTLSCHYCLCLACQRACWCCVGGCSRSPTPAGRSDWTLPHLWSHCRLCPPAQTST